ncbi:MAG TPA: hypothetical protein VMU87_03110, partial [Stellaceae bacterium]|nr:hypothetical protein [Stellaceae bacterium]
IHVKLLSFNIWGGGRQTLDQATSYAHTIGGNAPALSSVGALGLYTDLTPGAATNSVSAFVAGPVTYTYFSPALQPLTDASITTIGEPVLVTLSLSANGSTTGANDEFTISRGPIGAGVMFVDIVSVLVAQSPAQTPLTWTFLDAAPAGTWDYSVGVANNGTGSAYFSSISLTVTELRR